MVVFPYSHGKAVGSLSVKLRTLIAASAVFLCSACAFDLAKLPAESFERLPLRTVSDDARVVTPLPSSNIDTLEFLPRSPAVEKVEPIEESLDVNAVNAPLGALLYSLALQSGHQLQLRGTPVGSVTLKITRASLPDILALLSQQIPFIWSIESKRLSVWSGQNFTQSYSVDYLNILRSTQSSVGLATQVGTINASEGAGDSIANSSQTRIENSSEHDFWASLNADLSLLLNIGAEPLPDDAHTAIFSINPEAGLVTLSAMPEDHIVVKRYLEKLNKRAQRQVLIEATVVEVSLSESFEAGIDWQLLASGLRRFGDVKILSRPRVIALNNQSSVLKVVDNRVYFTAKVERSLSDTNTDVFTETQIHTVPVGLVMSVTPQISSDNFVMLNVRPTLSRILGFVNDPNPELAMANVRNGVPEIQVREMESMLRVHSGEVAVIGGLMQETMESDRSQLPVLGRLPIIKHLFAHSLTKKRQTELLIVLRPTVIPLATDVKR